MKKVVNADAGDADHVGGNDWDSLADYHSGTDVTPKISDVNTESRTRSGKKKLMNPANTFAYIETASAIVADRNVTEPLLAANDIRLYEAATQTETNKTISLTDNTVKDGTNVAGDIPVSNGTKYVRRAKGTALQVLQVNAGATDIEWATPASGGGTATAQFVTLATDATLTNERVLTAGDGITITDAGAGAAVTVAQDFISLARNRVGFVEDCLGDISVATNVFGGVVSGTGANTYTAANSEVGVFGVWELSTGTTTTGKSAVTGGDSSLFTLGQGITTTEWYLKTPILSTVGEEYIIRVGFMDSFTGGSNDGVYFVYDRLTSANWRMSCVNNGTSTSTTSATAVGTGWTRLKIVVNAAGTSASFYIGGTELTNSPITTNIPVTAARQTGIATSIIKSAGTTARLLNIDYIAFDIKLTTPR